MREKSRDWNTTKHAAASLLLIYLLPTNDGRYPNFDLRNSTSGLWPTNLAYQVTVLLPVSDCREVRHGVRVRGQDAGDRVRRGEVDPPDTGELRQVLNHDMQWAREHRLERQLHVAQVVPRAEQRVSTARVVILYAFLYIIYVHLLRLTLICCHTRMCIHIYICIYTYMYIYMYTYVYICPIHICIDTYIHTHLYDPISAFEMCRKQSWPR